MLRASEQFQNLLGCLAIGRNIVMSQQHAFGNLADAAFDLEAHLVVEILLTLLLGELWVVVTGVPALRFPDVGKHRSDELLPLSLLRTQEALFDHLASTVVEKVMLAMKGGSIQTSCFLSSAQYKQAEIPEKKCKT